MEVLLVALLVLALIALAGTHSKRKAAEKAASQSEDESGRLQQELGALRSRAAELQAKVGELSKYQGLSDAEQRAVRVTQEADFAAAAALERARIDAETLRTVAQQEAEAERTTLVSRAREQRQAAEEALTSAAAEAARIIEDAKKRAAEMAGDAYTAMQKAEQWERTAEAMKNVVEGYGDRYIVPTFGLLDEMADEFGFAEAGQRLKAARDRVRAMIKSETAATCDYVEANRRETAIRFVILAFNGDVDSALADVRHDNYGTLEQKLRDAFSIVNHLGQAFRNARIAEEYLQARLEELRWAVAVHELKLKEREEQRAIRERIREEEKAQREFERALKETQKEEDAIQRAMGNRPRNHPARGWQS